MKLYFSKEKNENSFEVLLPKISFKYCDNLDGRIYANIIDKDKTEIEVVQELIDELNPLIITKKTAIILNLLANPYFDELCQIIKKDGNMSIRKKSVLKKYIFGYLGSSECKMAFSNEKVEGYEVYNKKNMYMISKEILNLL